jgi:hypothetical protein
LGETLVEQSGNRETMLEALHRGSPGFGQHPAIGRVALWGPRRAPSNNTTRSYLQSVQRAERRLPEGLGSPELKRLCEDKSFSPRMRAKLRGCAVKLKLSFVLCQPRDLLIAPDLLG